MSNGRLPVVIMLVAMLALGAFVSSTCLAALPPEPPKPEPNVPTEPPTTAPLSNITVLLIGVDSLSAAQPNLESLALIQFQSGLSQFFLLNLSPETVVAPATGSSAAQTLRNIYAWDIPYNRGAVFTETALRRVLPGTNSSYAEVDFDRASLTQTITHLDQFKFGSAAACDEKVSGEALLSRFDSLPPDAANDRLHFQGDLLQCLFMAAQKQGWDLKTLMTDLGKRFYPYPERASTVLETAPFLPSAQFNVNFTPLNPLAAAGASGPTPQP